MNVHTNTNHDRPPSESVQWNEHEHHAPSIEPVAKRLVEEAGTPELAKQAIDQVSTPPDASSVLAAQFGMKSYLELFEASMPVTSAHGTKLCLACDQNGRWAVWDPEHLTIIAWYESFETANEQVKLPDVKKANRGAL